MSYFGTAGSSLQSVDSRGLWGDLTVGLPSALDCGARKRAQGRGSSEIEPVTLSALCRPQQCVGVRNDSEA